MLNCESKPYHRGSNIKTAFSLIELLVVIAIMSVLLAASAQVFSNSGNNARKASRDVIRAQIQQARAHAISSGNYTAVAIPLVSSDAELGAKAVGLIEVEKIGSRFQPLTGSDGRQKLLHQWELLPGNFHFIPASMTTSATPTVLESAEIMELPDRQSTIACHVLVIAPTGQIIQPSGRINIALAQARKVGGLLSPSEKNDGNAVYDLVQVNRLTGRTRSITP